MATSPNRRVDRDELERWCAGKAWTVVDGRLVRALGFSGFGPAFAFMTEVALAAERLDHHPDWSNVYDTVEIELHSHELGGVSERCLALAAAIDRAAARMGAIDR